MPRLKHKAKTSSTSLPSTSAMDACGQPGVCHRCGLQLPTSTFTEADTLGLHQIIKDLERTVKDLERRVTELTSARDAAQLARQLLDAELCGYKTAVRDLGRSTHAYAPLPNMRPLRW